MTPKSPACPTRRSWLKNWHGKRRKKRRRSVRRRARILTSITLGWSKRLKKRSKRSLKKKLSQRKRRINQRRCHRRCSRFWTKATFNRPNSPLNHQWQESKRTHLQLAAATTQITSLMHWRRVATGARSMRMAAWRTATSTGANVPSPGETMIPWMNASKRTLGSRFLSITSRTIGVSAQKLASLNHCSNTTLSMPKRASLTTVCSILPLRRSLFHV